jgi:hypothetical protein
MSEAESIELQNSVAKNNLTPPSLVTNEATENQNQQYIPIPTADQAIDINTESHNSHSNSTIENKENRNPQNSTPVVLKSSSGIADWLKVATISEPLVQPTDQQNTAVIQASIDIPEQELTTFQKVSEF